jgi:flagellar FliL protein
MAEKKEEKKEDGAGKSKKKLFIIIGAAVLVVLILAGIGGYFFLKKSPSTAEQPAGHEAAGKEAAGGHGEGASGEVPVPGAGPKIEMGPMVKIDEFIVNIISEEGSHYVKTSMSIEMTNTAVVDEVTTRMPQIRDAMLLLIGNKTFEELQDLQGKKQLKAEITSKINSFLQTGQVKSIYFTDFVVQ